MPAISLALCTALFLLGLNLRSPVANEPVALFFGPSAGHSDALQKIAALDGRIVRVGGWNNVVVAVFDQDVGVAQLWRHGAWVAMDPVFFSGCEPSGTSSRGGFPA
ncbi:hypothetical protein [Denitrobaculum tricleocarpae]|uniref:Uncharacterized protein n=1 Tax=Denitrobaculum tricleocarpae TaxID=2591009 RepID=A0A545TRQ1_9PROT|nr:hypothetical protein [Denitrobaculum tricleocarpae]TQV79895.1 hypothetical protein FKG95_14525 [Denitrobaculum tricleocarpae]